MSKWSNKKVFIASTVATAAVAITMVPNVSASTNGFSDVSSTYSDAVDFLVKNGITYGTTATSFGTTDYMKRADAAVLIARSVGLKDDVTYKDAGFKDVPERAQWAVNALVEKKILSGFNATEFGADEKLTRNQIAKIIANAGQLEIDEKSKTTQFKDVNANFAPFVEALVNAKVTKGKTKDTFGSYDYVTRGEMALFINRAQTQFGFMELLVMHLNDTHAYLDKFPYIATAVKQLRSENENNLLLHAGDVFSGDLYFNEFKGQAGLALMNELKFDAVTFGNHEFDLGSTADGHKALADFVKGAKFPLLTANVDFSSDPLFDGIQTKEVTASYKNGHIYNGTVLNVNGQKVGVFGLTTEETPTISSTGAIKFTNYIEQAKKSVKAFEDMGVDKIIALTHIGYDDSLKFDNDLELAKQVEGIDIIVGGHTHSNLKEPIIKLNHEAPTVIVQANEYGKALGTLDVTFNQYGYITSYKGELINTDHTASKPTELKADKEMVDLLAPYAAKILKVKTQSIGKEALNALDGRRQSDNDGISSVRYNETNLGNLMTDAMLAKAKQVQPKTSIALQNGGGIRASIPAGDITVGNVLKAMPFGNALAIVEISGADLKATLEHGLSADVREGGGLKENGAFLHVAGMKYTYDSTKEKGKRLQSVKVKKDDKYVDLVDTDMYFVTTANFTAKGGDGFEKFAEAYADGRVSEPGFVDYENFIEYVKTLETVEPQVEGRIVDVALSKDGK
ncbi:5'-nucleotidase C-terminal domain-containing protein [Filibacter tadaridae]|uniref:Trifunctional nucleotide phosphoesterase protein YfkN n=1 Tax=Filibacter tadaridae TaxID=2483811 RepID=A0A3P5WUW2_9BACL|nr:5'-nucleotidase C-terminal domain-containing protein [Filibacter tadaridae]VDC19096.1 Trifunctional nucleotide phosphoesterase protein YfkN precursor [Filibacter tadaridae]